MSNINKPTQIFSLLGIKPTVWKDGVDFALLREKNLWNQDKNQSSKCSE